MATERTYITLDGNEAVARVAYKLNEVTLHALDNRTKTVPNNKVNSLTARG